MSYDLAFIKTKNLNFDNVYDLLETTEPDPENEIFIDKGLMNKIISEIKSLGLDFEIFEGKNRDYYELNFPSYQVSMFNSEIAISLPYWDENENKNINSEIEQITNILLSNGFTGFDSQTEEFISVPFEVQSTFVESKNVIDNHMNLESPGHKYSATMYVGIIIGVLIIGVLIWKVLTK